MREEGRQVGVKKLEIELRGSISRVPLKTAPGIDHRGWWVPWTIWMGCWGCPFNHSVQDGVGGAHQGTCTSPLFSHSPFTSSLPQTIHPLLLRTLDGPGRSPMCSRLVVVDVEASARTCLDLLIAFRSYGRFTSVCSRQAHSNFHKYPKIMYLF